jgi:hypothetical protein
MSLRKHARRGRKQVSRISEFRLPRVQRFMQRGRKGFGVLPQESRDSAVSTRSRGCQRPTLHLIILALGIVGGVTVVVSGFYLIEHWAALMEQFDFTERMRPTVNPRRYPDSVYLLPAFSTTFGVVSTLAFTTLLYRRVRGIG